jgi:hypothetical protein
MSAVIEIDWFNSYIIRKVKSEKQVGGTSNTTFGWPGVTPTGGDTSTASSNLNYFIEESRIRGGYNNTATDNGARAYLDEQYPLQQNRTNTLIYSGVFNSRTGKNDTNVFSVADDITKSLNPSYGSIQRTYSEDTNLIVFQENKIHRALIDKDTIYTTESGTQTQAGRAVIGQFVPYKGEYGISKNPESFAIYNYRKYFADKNRNAIMRLSNDGLTEVSQYGMMDYFRDQLSTISDSFKDVSQRVTISQQANAASTCRITTTQSLSEFPELGSTAKKPGGQTEAGTLILIKGSQGNQSENITNFYFSKPLTNTYSAGDEIEFLSSYKDKINGGWDIHNKNYVMSMQTSSTRISNTTNYQTLAFDEKINGWVSFFSYKPDMLFSVINKFYTVNKSNLYEHYDQSTVGNRNVFYGNRTRSSITFVFNEQPSVVKNFQTINYEGSNGWEVYRYSSGFTGFDKTSSTYSQSQDTTNNQPSGSLVGNISIPSYLEGAYDGAGNTGTSAVATNPPLLRAGFDRKENKYVANLKNNSSANAGEILFGNQMSGIKGYFATVTIQDDSYTDLGGPKELWSAGTKYVVSSY